MPLWLKIIYKQFHINSIWFKIIRITSNDNRHTIYQGLITQNLTYLNKYSNYFDITYSCILLSILSAAVSVSQFRAYNVTSKASQE